MRDSCQNGTGRGTPVLYFEKHSLTWVIGAVLRLVAELTLKAPGATNTETFLWLHLRNLAGTSSLPSRQRHGYAPPRAHKPLVLGSGV